MEQHIFLLNSNKEITDFNEMRNFCGENFVTPIVGYSPEYEKVFYDAHILAENKKLWEKFSQIFEGHVTCEDKWLFSKHLMDYETEGVYFEGNLVTSLKFFTTDESECAGYDTPNPNFKETFAYLDHEDRNATIDDFIGFGDEHIWRNSQACGK